MKFIQSIIKGVCLAAVICASALAQKKSSNAITAISKDDLKRDLYAMADDHFKGRESGTLDELKVSVWLAEQARAAGIEPAGDDGTFFQFFSLLRTRIASASTVTVGSKSYRLYDEALIMQTATASVNAPIVFLAKGKSVDEIDVKGKVVAIEVSSEGMTQAVSLPGRRYFRYVSQRYTPALVSKGAAAIIFIADATAEANWNFIAPVLKRGSYRVETGTAMTQPQASIPTVWLRSTELKTVQQSQQTASIQLVLEKFDYPSVNIVGKIKGTDATLANEYVLFSGHQDHDGIRSPDGTDSIYNGADDNASASVALLAIARAFKKSPGKRSALFVWHGAEERSMLGSRWFANNPTVPKNSIAAVLNADMIGQNHPDSAALLGSQSPHKNSTELVTLALQANNETAKFKLDTLWDKPNHVEGFYFRSDHMPYARVGIPAIFYTTLLHPDYHTPRDEAKTINYDKLLKVTQWMYLTGWKVANAPERPKVDPNFKLER